MTGSIDNDTSILCVNSTFLTIELWINLLSKLVGDSETWTGSGICNDFSCPRGPCSWNSENFSLPPWIQRSNDKVSMKYGVFEHKFPSIAMCKYGKKQSIGRVGVLDLRYKVGRFYILYQDQVLNLSLIDINVLICIRRSIILIPVPFRLHRGSKADKRLTWYSTSDRILHAHFLSGKPVITR